MLIMPPDDLLLAFRHTFRRSRLRVEIMLVLLEFGRQTLPDLARLAGGTTENVYGAMWGVEKRYRFDQCLLTVGLIDLHEVDGVSVYELSAIGQLVARALREQVDKRRGTRHVVRT